MTRKLMCCLSTYSVLILLALSTQALAANQAKTKPATTTTISSVAGNSSSSEQVEGSANVPSKLADIEVNGSGYPTDDEDGDDVHGSGKPPSSQSAAVPAAVPAAAATTTTTKSKPTSQASVAVTVKPTIALPTTTSFKPLVQPKPKPAANDKEIKVEEDEDDDDDEDDEDDDEDDDDFADENVHNDDDFFTTTTTTHHPVVIVTTMTPPRSHVAHSTIPPRHQPPLVTSTISSGPFSPFHETMTNGFYAAIAGGVLVAVITAILLVLFVVFRIRKKDEGSYALDEPKQPKPYATYAYTKASTKEFYA